MVIVTSHTSTVSRSCSLVNWINSEPNGALGVFVIVERWRRCSEAVHQLSVVSVLGHNAAEEFLEKGLFIFLGNTRATFGNIFQLCASH